MDEEDVIKLVTAVYELRSKFINYSSDHSIENGPEISWVIKSVAQLADIVCDAPMDVSALDPF